MKTEIRGNFISCARAILDLFGNQKAWLPSFVRLDAIKTIHTGAEHCKYYRVRNEQTVFYTYKDEWYVCNVEPLELCNAIDDFLEKQKPAKPIKSEHALDACGYFPTREELKSATLTGFSDDTNDGRNKFRCDCMQKD